MVAVSIEIVVDPRPARLGKSGRSPSAMLLALVPKDDTQYA
jgi:hypothetical protein